MENDTITPAGLNGPALGLLLELLGALHKQDISYCYWKSSRRVDEVLAGEADLDLLFARQDQHRAQRVMLECGLKLCPSVFNRDHPAVLSFLGYDEPSGRIVHVHAHFRLLAGGRLLKNHRLPWEEAILAQAIARGATQMRMLDPASEAVLLMVRACLDLRRTDLVTLRSWRAATRKFALDRAELAAQVDRMAFRGRAAEFMSADAADLLTEAMYGARPLQHHGRLRGRVRRELAAHRTYNAAEAHLRSAGRAVLWLTGGLNKSFLHVPRPWSRRAPGGGMVVAVLGVDGSGKTTVTRAIRAWLGREFDVLPVYFGTGGGRPSLLLLPFRLMVPLIQPLLGAKPKGASHGRVSSRRPGLAYSALLTLWATVLAAEKRLKLLAARRGADRGLVVIADRYPQDEILDFNDAPLLHRLAGVSPWLRRFEANAYALARRLPPDLVVKLVATPETIAKREPDMDRSLIPERTAAVSRLAFPGARVVCVDAEQPLADVICAVKREIWRLL